MVMYMTSLESDFVRGNLSGRNKSCHMGWCVPVDRNGGRSLGCHFCRYGRAWWPEGNLADSRGRWKSCLVRVSIIFSLSHSLLLFFTLNNFQEDPFTMSVTLWHISCFFSYLFFICLSKTLKSLKVSKVNISLKDFHETFQYIFVLLFRSFTW